MAADQSPSIDAVEDPQEVTPDLTTRHAVGIKSADDRPDGRTANLLDFQAEFVDGFEDHHMGDTSHAASPQSHANSHDAVHRDMALRKYLGDCDNARYAWPIRIGINRVSAQEVDMGVNSTSHDAFQASIETSNSTRLGQPDVRLGAWP